MLVKLMKLNYQPKLCFDVAYAVLFFIILLKMGRAERCWVNGVLPSLTSALPFSVSIRILQAISLMLYLKRVAYELDSCWLRVKVLMFMNHGGQNSPNLDGKKVHGEKCKTSAKVFVK